MCASFLSIFSLHLSPTSSSHLSHSPSILHYNYLLLKLAVAFFLMKAVKCSPASAHTSATL